MRKLSGLLLSLSVLILTPFVLSGCGEEKVVSSDILHNDPFAGVDTTGAFSEFPEVYPGGISAEEINEIGRLEHERRIAEGSVLAKMQGAWQLYVEVPFYSQRDPNWGDHPLGFGQCGPSDNIYNYGCHLCCIAMLYAKWGYSSLTPPVLNDWSLYKREHYAFNSSGCGDLIRLPYALNYPAMSRPYRTISPQQIYSELAAGHPVIVRTTVGGSHFMIIFAFDGQRFWVKDPWRDWTQQNQPLYGNAHLDDPFRVYGY